MNSEERAHNGDKEDYQTRIQEAEGIPHVGVASWNVKCKGSIHHFEVSRNQEVGEGVVGQGDLPSLLIKSQTSETSI